MTARHSTPIRGLMSAKTSPLFQGRFGRMFRNLPAATFGSDDAENVTNLAALRDALKLVACEGCICLSDGFPVARLGYEQRAVIGGDARSAAIAAASVIAKETRDRYMRRADAEHPGWEFAQHVGYATPEHREAIRRLGVSPLHRLSFQSAAYQQLALAD